MWALAWEAGRRWNVHRQLSVHTPPRIGNNRPHHHALANNAEDAFLSAITSTGVPVATAAGYRLSKGVGSMSCCRVVFSAIVAVAAFAVPAARAQGLPRLNTNQAYVEEAARALPLDVTDPMAVFGFVLASLPERVKVYPTENYYYFTFLHNGVPYAGNIRLDASNRDDGKVSFGYYEDYAKWKPEAPVTFRLLDSADGVRLEKLDRFTYRLSYRDKAVVFELNDLTQAKPSRLGPDETFIGPICDESGVRFFLIYNARLKIFHYVLDESAPAADALFAVKGRDRILIGKRTGFAFYRDQRLDRQILIGVYLHNAELNTWFDGPFDQLPDNFIEGETLRDALIAVDPSLKGQIDRFGAWPGGEQRYMIAPYVMYEKASDLAFFDQCATSPKTPPGEYYRCFSVDESLVKSEAPRRSTRSRKSR